MRDALLAFMMIAVVGCASAPAAIRSGFDDIPVPSGLAFKPNQSTIIESQNVKAVRQVYAGRVERGSLVTAFRTTLEANGWRYITSNRLPGQGITQIYEKGGNSLEVRVYEGWWNTWVEVTTTRVLSAPTPASSPR